MDNTDERKRIGSRIALLRRERGLTVREFADKIGVTYQNINKIENGRYSVGIDILSRIAEGLDCRVDLVLKDESAGCTAN